MSKQNTSRSRADKVRTTVNTVIVPVSNEIIPGKYSDVDWNITVDQDSNEEFIHSLLDEIFEASEKQIYESYLKSKLAPYTVNLAKQAMIKILEWEFLSHDLQEDEQTDEEVWQQDEEPDTCIIDSWAQGYFPKRQATFDLLMQEPSFVPESVPEESIRAEESEEEVQENIRENSQDIDQELDREETELIVESEMNNAVEITAEQNQKPTKRKVPFKPYKGKIRYEGLEMLTETLMETEERILKDQRQLEDKLKRGSSSQSTTSRQMDTVDYEGRVIQKLFSTSLKNYHSMKSSDILQHSNEQLLTVLSIPAEQLNLQRVKANHKMVEYSFNRKQASNKENSAVKKKDIYHKSQDEDSRKMVQVHENPLLPVSMIDSIEPVAGVTVQEGERVKKSVAKKTRSSQSEKELSYLRPIKTQTGEQSKLIDEIINTNIQIKQIDYPSKIPPINKIN